MEISRRMRDRDLYMHRRLLQFPIGLGRCLLHFSFATALAAGFSQAQDPPANGNGGVEESVEEPMFPGDDEYEPARPSPNSLANPAVRSILGSTRESAYDYLRATRLLLKLGEGDLAAGEFHRLLQLQPDEAAKVELVNQFGPVVIGELSRATELGPAAGPFADSLRAASKAAAQSAERVNKLLDQLGSNDLVERNSAVAALASTGNVVVVPLIGLLADAQAPENKKQAARATLVRLGALAERPLLAVLESSDKKLLAEAAELLAAIGSGEAAPLLAYPALSGGSPGRAYESLTKQPPSVASAMGFLERTLNRLEGGVPVFIPDFEGKVTYWVLDGKAINTSNIVPLTLSVSDANTLYSAELAKDLAKLRPESTTAQTKAIRLDFESVGILRRNGFSVDYPLAKMKDLPVGSLDLLLAEALEQNQAEAARFALQVIGERKDSGMLMTTDAKPSPTAKALTHPHPTVRIAALEAIASIDPPTPFPGSSKVCPTIVELATARGERLALAAAPRIDTAATWAGGLASMGIASEVANTGDGLFKKANLLADVELILIDMHINHSAVRDAVYQLRVNPSTALVPIALIARETQFTRARTIASEHQRVDAFFRPHSDESMRSLVNTMLVQMPANWPTTGQRLDQRERAKKVMNQLLENERTFYRLRAASKQISRSVLPPGEVTWRLLSQLGTQDSQLAMLAHANSTAEDLESRQAAAKAFDDSVGRFGLRITANDIVRQYDLYNASENDTKESQQIFAGLLDTIERGRKKKEE